MGDWIVEGTECLDKVVTVMSQLVMDEVVTADCFEPMLSVMSVLAGHCCEGDYCIMTPEMVEKYRNENKMAAMGSIMQTLYQHQWEGFDYDAAQKIVVKLIANDMLTLRWIEWNGDKP